MAQQIPGFLKKDGNKLLFNQKDKEFIFYVPEVYFNGNSAGVYGSYHSLLGVLDYTIEDTKTGKQQPLKPFRFQTVFLCKPYKVDKVKEIKLTKSMKPQDYRILRFKQGDEVVSSIRVPELIDNVEEFFKLFLITGNISTTIDYDVLHEYFEENMNLSGNSYDMNIQQFGMVVSEMCRSANNPSIPFRYTKIEDMKGYQVISIKELPNYISPFVSITSENWDESLMSAILMKDGKESPLEKVMMS